MAGLSATQTREPATPTHPHTPHPPQEATVTTRPDGWTPAHDTVNGHFLAIADRDRYDTADLVDMTMTLIDTIRPHLTPPAASPRRYDQCGADCTVDCGHCKGAGRPAASAEQQHLIEIDAGSGYKFRAICTCGHTTEWLFGPDRAVDAGQAHTAGLNAAAELVNQRDQALAENEQLRAKLNHAAKEASREHGRAQFAEAGRNALAVAYADRCIERDQARERVDALARELADFIPARARLDDSLRAITRTDLGLDTDGQTIWLSHWVDDHTCAGSPITAMEPGDSWLDIVNAVTTHTCEAGA